MDEIEETDPFDAELALANLRIREYEDVYKQLVAKLRIVKSGLDQWRTFRARVEAAQWSRPALRDNVDEDTGDVEIPTQVAS